MLSRASSILVRVWIQLFTTTIGQRTIPTTFQITFYCYIMEPEEIGQDDWQQPLVRYLSDFKKYAKRCQACKKDGPVQHVPASELHPILKTSRLDALIPCFTSARSHVGKYALAKLCLTQNQSGKGREELKKLLSRRYLLHPIALHSRLKKMNPWISRPFLQTDLLPSSPLSSRDNRDRENELTFAHEPSVFGAVLSGVYATPRPLGIPVLWCSLRRYSSALCSGIPDRVYWVFSG